MLRYFDGRPHSELRTIVFIAMLLSQVGAEPFDRVPNCRYTGKLSFSSNEIVMKMYWTPFGALWCLFDLLLVTPSMSSHLGVGFGEQYLILRCFYCWILGTFGPVDPCVFEYFVFADSVSVDVFWIRAAALVAFVEFGRFLPLGANGPWDFLIYIFSCFTVNFCF